MYPQDEELSKDPEKTSKDEYPIKETENKDEQHRTERNTMLNHSLKDQGMDEAQAAGIANTPDAGQRAEEAHVYEDMPMEELYEEAKKAGIDGYYDMRRNDIVMALKQTRKKD